MSEVPSAPLRFCSAPNCNARVPNGRCAQHASAQRQHHRRYQHHDDVNYGRPWQREAKRFLAQHPLCVDCGKLATDVDHVIPHRGDKALFMDETNWAPRCKSCHSAKTAREVGFGG